MPLLSAAERHQLLVEWNDTRRTYPTNVCVHELIEAQVERTPNAIALVFGKESLSYGELNRRAKTPLTFDVSVSELFRPLVSGARLVVAQAGLQGDSRYLLDTICKNGVTILEFVPAVLAAFLEEKEVRRCLSLRRVISGGEGLSLELQERFFAALPHAELDNSYGPTETTIDIECVGRIDQQIKIRGSRIEPGEIEAVLEQHPAVRDAVVVIREHTSSDKRVLAFVAGELSALSGTVVRDFLKAKLPDFMLPSSIVALEKLPLNANGKVDRRALSWSPSPSRAKRYRFRRATRWKHCSWQCGEKVLRVEPIGVTDDFSSLAATRSWQRASSRKSKQCSERICR